MFIRGLFTDYDGTLSPINSEREASMLSAELMETLDHIASRIPVGVITTKDIHFIKPRTPFAHAWSAVGGLEINIPPIDLLDPRITGEKLRDMECALDYARREINREEFIEEKRNLHGRVLAFCIDWRRSLNTTLSRSCAEKVAAFCRRLGLMVVTYGTQPFMDFFPCPVNKGEALEKLKRIFRLSCGILYMGDSRTDNDAFRVADVSIGIIHPETPQDLECKYWLNFGDMAGFLGALLDNSLVFNESLLSIVGMENR